MPATFIRRRASGIPFYVFQPFEGSRLLHGIFTRHGGVSQGPFSSLNVSRAAGDSAEAVAENLDRLLGALGLGRRQTVQLRGVHGRQLKRVEQAARTAFPGLAERWFQPGRRFDLWQANEEQLRAAGVDRIYSARTCTPCHKEEFFSVRGLRLPTGHLATVVALA